MKKRIINPIYLKKNLGAPLTDKQLKEAIKLANIGKLNGEIYKFRGNFYIIKRKNGNKST